MSPFKNNRPVADFYCASCSEEYELKSKKSTFGQKVVDGAYKTMIERLRSQNNPNFFFLHYDVEDYSVRDFMIIPKHFFVPNTIERREPLQSSARQSGWVGCNILLSGIPNSGKIFYIKDRNVKTKNSVLKGWQKALFLRGIKKVALIGLDFGYYELHRQST